MTQSQGAPRVVSWHCARAVPRTRALADVLAHNTRVRARTLVRETAFAQPRRLRTGATRSWQRKTSSEQLLRKSLPLRPVSLLGAPGGTEMPRRYTEALSLDDANHVYYSKSVLQPGVVPIDLGYPRVALIAAHALQGSSRPNHARRSLSRVPQRRPYGRSNLRCRKMHRNQGRLVKGLLAPRRRAVCNGYAYRRTRLPSASGRAQARCRRLSSGRGGLCEGHRDRARKYRVAARSAPSQSTADLLRSWQLCPAAG